MTRRAPLTADHLGVIHRVDNVEMVTTTATVLGGPSARYVVSYKILLGCGVVMDSHDAPDADGDTATCLRCAAAPIKG